MLHAPEENATLVIFTTRTNSADPLLGALLPAIFPERFPSVTATPAAGTPASDLPVPG